MEAGTRLVDNIPIVMEEFLNRCPKRNLLRWFLDLTVLLFLQGDLIKSDCSKS